jgi:hypothetical protein
MSDHRYFLRFKGRVLGPFTRDKALDMVKRGQITRQHELSQDGSNWSLAETFEEFFPANRGKTVVNATEAIIVADPVSNPKQTEWFAHLDGSNQGPVDESVIRSWIAAGKVTGNTMIWRSGMESWLEAGVVRPEWFPAKPTRSISPAGETDAKDPLNDKTIAVIHSVALGSRGWMLFLAILCIVLSAPGIIFSVLMFVAAISSAGSGPAKALQVVAILIQLFSLVVFLYINVLLIRVSSQLQVLHFKPTASSLKNLFTAYNQFWFTLGLVILVLLVLVLLFTVIVVASGASMLSSGFPGN